MSERASTKGRDGELASARLRPEPSSDAAERLADRIEGLCAEFGAAAIPIIGEYIGEWRHARRLWSSGAPLPTPPEWQTDDRAPWVANSLRSRITDLRSAESRCREAFTKPYMGEPANYLADAYAEAADLLAAKLRSIQVLENRKGNLADATPKNPLSEGRERS